MTVTHNFRVGDQVDYWNLDESKFGGGWYRSSVVAVGVKLICKHAVPFYVVMLPTGETASFEKWRIRAPPETVLMSETNDIVKQGTPVEFVWQLPGSNEISDSPLTAWLMGRLEEDCSPGSQPVIRFLNETFWDTKAYERSLIRIPQHDPATSYAWKTPQPLVHIISELEHLVPDYIQKAATAILEIDKTIDSMTVTQLEKHRQGLIDAAEAFFVSRNYEKAILIARALQKFEDQVKSL
jgi:hypothetical protein